ncbi:MAG: hypothetical protein O2923_00145 [Verrucomicrobia bacterium]|nr:hypothetical protein [Verrucomicrobiota bacterium]MDA1085546.1 hypothetical protein [Verrucomicrobiota bacterium]
MKSAYELAMERLGGETQYTDEQKEQLAELDRKFDAKVAELKLRAEQVAKDHPLDSAAIEAARDQTVHEVARLEEKREAEKDQLRKS